MKVAIDIDGTLDGHQARIGPLTCALVAAGHDVVLLTGTSMPHPHLARMEQLQVQRQQQVAPLGACFREIVICVGENSNQVASKKGAYCLHNGIDLLIDDSKNYCEAVRQLSPTTLVLHVHP